MGGHGEMRFLELRRGDAGTMRRGEGKRNRELLEIRNENVFFRVFREIRGSFSPALSAP